MDKAIGSYGGFETTTGTFMVSGSVTAYFSSVEATRAVRDNECVTMEMILRNEGEKCGGDGGTSAMVIDLPLIALGDARASVELDAAITVPINFEAGSGEELSEDLDHTLMITYLDYLPPH